MDKRPFASQSFISAARFVIQCQGWSAGLGFSELAGFQSTVEHQEYSYNSMFGNVHTKQFGRAKPPSVTLKRGLDAQGFAQLFAWHMLARGSAPLAKVTAVFMILDPAGNIVASSILEGAWCAKLEMDPATAGSSDVIKLKATIECDSITMV